MDIMTIGSVNSYLMNMNMETKWRTKRANGDYSADGTKTVSQWAEEQKKKADENTKETGKKNDTTLNAINSKLSRGGRLTPAEKQYLRLKDAAAYSRVQRIEAAQRDFENRLRQCKTKDEVRRLKMAYAASALGNVNSIKNNPHITEETKSSLISEQQQQSSAIERAHNDFVKSGAFSALPTDAERAKAFKKLRNADRDKKKQDEKSEGVKKVKTVTYGKDGKVKIEEKEAKKLNKSEGARRIAAKAKAEQSYEVKKVRRSRKVYRPTVTAGDLISAVSDKPSLDTKA
ncbi:MAG: hypothetical protein NC078_00110 [Ruminococcus sp.]|nr:hypothetical protein [Ruminococcus sp.]